MGRETVAVTRPDRPSAAEDGREAGQAARRGRSAKHLPELDGIRGVAILLVLMFHFLGVITPAMARQSGVLLAMRRVGGMGWCGVDLFFVLSGFLITGILLDTKSTGRFFRNFYARRTLRIFPLYYAVLVAVFVVGPLVVPAAPGDHRLIADQAWFWLYGTNVYCA